MPRQQQRQQFIYKLNSDYIRGLSRKWPKMLVEAGQNEHENINEKKITERLERLQRLLVNLSHCIVNVKRCFLPFILKQIAGEVIAPAAINKLILSI